MRGGDICLRLGAGVRKEGECGDSAASKMEMVTVLQEEAPEDCARWVGKAKRGGCEKENDHGFIHAQRTLSRASLTLREEGTGRAREGDQSSPERGRARGGKEGEM